jgi:hypothetical protein
MRPAHQHLGGGDWPDAGKVHQPRCDRVHQRGQLAAELVDLDVQLLDTLGGDPQHPDGRAMLRRSGRPVPRPRTAGDLGRGRHAAEFGAHVVGRADDQRLGLVDRGHSSADSVASAAQQHPSCLAVAATAWQRQMLMAKDITSCTDRIDPSGLGAGAAGWPLGAADRNDPLAVGEQEGGQSSAVASGPSTAQQRRSGICAWAKFSRAR